MASLSKSENGVAPCVQRIARERVKHARSRLHGKKDLAAIHAARKDVKQLRALLRLLRPVLGERSCRRQMRRLRKVSRPLAPARDAHARLKTFCSLTHGYSGVLKVRPLASIHAALQHECHSHQESLSSARKLRRCLKKVGRTLERVPNRKITCELIEAGVEISYLLGRREFERARRRPSPENLHAWRKRVKDLWYQLGLVQRVDSRHYSPVIVQLERLGGLLGEDHDLVVLREHCEKLARKAPQVSGREILGRVIDRRQTRLRREALRVGARVFANDGDKLKLALRTGAVGSSGALGSPRFKARALPRHQKQRTS